MANTKSVTVMIARAMQKAGVEGLDDRHPAATLLLWFNDWQRELRVKLANLGIQGLTEPTVQASLPTAPPTNEKYLEVPLPDNAVGIYGVDVLENQEWDPLVPGSFAQRRDYQRTGANRPTHFLTLALPLEAAAPAVPAAGKLMLFPNSSTGLPYRIWFLRAWVDVTDAATLIYGHDTWHEWVVQGMVRTISEKDNDSNQTLEEAKLRQAEVWAVIKKGVQSMNLAQPIQRVRARRRRR